MLGFLLFAIVHITAFIGLAKRGRGSGRRKMGRYLRGSINQSLSLGTLAGATLISVNLGDSVTEKALVSSVVLQWSMTDFTATAGDGPISFGVAHSDYSDGEIEAVLESTNSWEQGDKVAQEIAKRLVRRVGVFDIPASALEMVVPNDGKPIKTKLNWLLTTGQTLKVWAYNEGTSALATTVPIVRVNGHANLWPR